MCVCLCAAHWWSSRAGGAFAILGAGAGFGQRRTVCLLPLDHHSMTAMKNTKRWQWHGMISAKDEAGKVGVWHISADSFSVVNVSSVHRQKTNCDLTRPGSSQHLSLLAHEVLQTMSKIWSWNWRGRKTRRGHLNDTNHQNMEKYTTRESLPVFSVLPSYI